MAAVLPDCGKMLTRIGAQPRGQNSQNTQSFKHETADLRPQKNDMEAEVIPKEPRKAQGAVALDKEPRATIWIIARRSDITREDPMYT